MANTSTSNGNGTGSGSPCGACKFLRRKCASDCIFAPYFCSEQGPARFAAIHKVFGASNASKMLLHVPVADRCEAVVTIAYEAQARIRDPVYGCVAHIFALQQQVACLQAQLMQLKAQMAQGLMMDPRDAENPWMANMGALMFQNYTNVANCHVSPQSSMESIEQTGSVEGGVGLMQEIESMREDEVFSFHFQPIVFSKKRPNTDYSQNNIHDLGELQEIAVRMMRN